MPWTKAQEKAIKTIDGNVLVSASAGSGKTAVMIERVIQLVSQKKIDVSNLLVLTFASDAASEMKTRLLQSLKENVRKENADKKFLSKQIASVPISSICTFHSFCLDILRTYFYKINLDPQFTIISQSDLDSLKNQSVIEVINEYIEKDDLTFIELMDIFSVKRRDAAFKNILLSIYDFAISKEDFEEFLERDFLACYEDKNTALSYVHEYILQNMQVLLSNLDNAIRDCRKVGLFEDCEALEEMKAYVQKIKGGKDAYEICGAIVENPRFPSGRGEKKLQGEQVQFHAHYKTAREFVRDALDKIRKKFAYTIGGLDEEIQINAKYCRKLSEVVIRLREILQEKKRKRTAIDFSDFEHFSLQLLKDESIRASLREKYKYIFIDEYQDTNGVQESILRLITDGRNMFMVGDVKQSIYGFRHCSPDIFRTKYDAYTKVGGGQAIELNENFRSRNDILEFCNGVFGAVMTRRFGGIDYNKSGTFVIKTDENKDDFSSCADVHMIDIVKNNSARVENKIYDMFSSQDHVDINDGSKYEGHLISNLIDSYIEKKIFDKKIGKYRKVEFSDIAILVRGYSNYNMQILQYLQNVKCFPIVSTSEEAGDYSVDILRDLAKVIDNWHQDYPLTSVMLSVFGGFSEKELADIKIYQKQVKKVKYFFEAVKICLSDEKFHLNGKLSAFFDKIKKYRQTVEYEGVAGTLLSAINECGYDGYILKKPNGKNRMIKIYNYLATLSSSVYSHDISGYLYDADMKSRLSFGDSSISQSNSITMMTIHKSKGLEFPIVILCGCGQSFNNEDSRQKVVIDDALGVGIDRYDIQNRLKMPSFIKEAVKAKAALKAKEEEIRLLYVAMTRGKNHLDIVAFESLEDTIANRGVLHESQINSYIDMLAYFLKDYDNSKYRFASVKQYMEKDFDFTGNQGDVERAAYDVPIDRVRDMMIEKLSYEYDNKRDIDSSQKYSVSALSQNDLAIDELKIKRGNFLHKMLERCNISSTLPEIKAVAEKLSLDFSPQEKDFEAIFNVLNCDLLKSYMHCKIYKEQEFMMYMPPMNANLFGGQDVLVQGKIDMLIIDGDKAIVIDFKSGKQTQKSASERYGEQLKMYADAVEKILGIDVYQRIIYSVDGNNYFVI